MKRIKGFKRFSSLALVLLFVFTSGNVVTAGKPQPVNSDASAMVETADRLKGEATIDLDTLTKTAFKLVATIDGATPTAQSWRYPTGVTLNKKSVISGNTITTEFYYTPLDDGATIVIGYDANKDGNIENEKISMTFALKQLDPNEVPVALIDSYELDEDTVLSVGDIDKGILINDIDADGDPLTAELSSDVAHGELVLKPDGTFTYTPDNNYSGNDSFTYFAYDGKDSSVPVEVNFKVLPINDAPVAQDDQYSVAMDTTLSVLEPGVLSNDSDVDNDRLVANNIDLDLPSYGILTFNSDGSFNYIPNKGYTGDDSFTYKVFDGSAYSDVATVKVTVNPQVNDYVYLALGDSIPAGVSYEDSTEKEIIDSYTDKLSRDLAANPNYEEVIYYDQSVSGYTIINLYNQITDATFTQNYIVDADLITICIGANDIMNAAPSTGTGARDFYNINWNDADDGLDNIEAYWDIIITYIYEKNSDVELVVMNLYNPYSVYDKNTNATPHPLYGNESRDGIMHDIVDNYFYNNTDDMDGDGTTDYGLNYVIEHPEEVYGSDFVRNYEVVDVYSEFEKDTDKNTNIAFYDNFGYVKILWYIIPVAVQDPHPTMVGQELLYTLFKNRIYIK